MFTTGQVCSGSCIQPNSGNTGIATRSSSQTELHDVTLACYDDQTIQAHRVMLGAVSPGCDGFLRKTPHPHPLIHMRGATDPHGRPPQPDLPPGDPKPLPWNKFICLRDDTFYSSMLPWSELLQPAPGSRATNQQLPGPGCTEVLSPSHQLQLQDLSSVQLPGPSSHQLQGTYRPRPEFFKTRDPACRSCNS